MPSAIPKPSSEQALSLHASAVAAKLLTSLSLLVTLTAGCHDGIEVHSEEMVIEGWIAEGQHPMVFVTSTLPITDEETPIDDLKEYVAQWARVGITTDVRFHDDPATHDHYLLFSREEQELQNPQLCMFGILDDVTLPHSETTMSARRGGLITESKTYTPFYAIGDEVEVSLLHVDSITFKYWRGFADSKELGFSLLFNVTTPLDGNIQGAHGIWYGCGIDRKRIKVE